VHTLASSQTEIKQVVAALIQKCSEIAGTINDDHGNFLSHQGAMGATKEKLEGQRVAIT
jgi:hypothetical protein